ncbi:MAG: ATP-binding protein [Acidimicrobiales bacterium]
MNEPVITVPLHRDQDLVVCRQRAGQIAELLGLERLDQTRLATAVSEIARNAFSYAGSGSAAFSLEHVGSESWLTVTVTDEGPGIVELDRVLSGAYRSRTGMGLGIVGSRRLMDRFDIETAPGAGTRVTMAKCISPSSPATGAEIASELLRRQPPEPADEVARQNRELLEALDSLRSRHEQVERLNGELSDTNRGIVALYAELEDRSEEVRQANEGRARFFSSVGHELRTPISSIVALAGLMLAGHDGGLSVEQARQAELILSAGNDLSTMVDDLIDLARARTDKLEIQVAPVDVAELLTTLRGALRPLATSEEVDLVVEEATDIPIVHTDGAKVSQILRNLVINALKFTERGEVRVSVSADPADASVSVTVADSGIGIDARDQERVFEEFSQVTGPLQAGAKGSGLGLAVSRALAEVLGGHLVLESSPGTGSSFTLTVPVGQPAGTLPREEPTPGATAGRFTKALVIDDDPGFRYLLGQLLAPLVPSVTEAAGVAKGVQAVITGEPDLVFLDLVMPDGRGDEMLERLQEDGHLDGATVFVCTSFELEPAQRRALEDRVAAVLPKDASLPERVRAALVEDEAKGERKGERKSVRGMRA